VLGLMALRESMTPEEGWRAYAGWHELEVHQVG
jgi:hypothetical protein